MEVYHHRESEEPRLLMWMAFRPMWRQRPARSEADELQACRRAALRTHLLRLRSPRCRPEAAPSRLGRGLRMLPDFDL